MASELETSGGKSAKRPLARRFQYEGAIWKVEPAGAAAEPASDQTIAVRFTCAATGQNVLARLSALGIDRMADVQLSSALAFGLASPDRHSD